MILSPARYFFKEISIQEWLETITHITQSSSPLDIIPNKFLLEVLHSVAPSDYFKFGSDQALLKLPDSEPSEHSNYSSFENCYMNKVIIIIIITIIMQCVYTFPYTVCVHFRICLIVLRCRFFMFSTAFFFICVLLSTHD